MIFADATSPYNEARFVIVGIPYEDKEMSFRKGTSKAPDYIRELSYNYESYDIFTGVDFTNIQIHDAGNFGIEEGKKFVKSAIKDGKFPIILGGAHSITSDMIPYDEIDGVVVLDAHADFREEYLGDKSSHACTARRIFEKVGNEGIINIGVRSISKEEKEDAEKLGFRYYTSREFGVELADEIKYEKIYLSIDMDVFDPCYASGVSNPEPFGLGYEIFDFIERIVPKVIAMDVVETCPPYDDGKTGLLAAKIITKFVAWKSSRSSEWISFSNDLETR